MDHNIIRFNRDIVDAALARSLLEAAGVDYLTGLVEIQSVSEEQRQYAANARIRVLANMWENIQHAYKTAWFAAIIVKAANKHNEAQWWITHDPGMSLYITHCLDADIEAEMSQ